jgi:hypothetical protein
MEMGNTIGRTKEEIANSGINLCGRLRALPAKAHTVLPLYLTKSPFLIREA